MKKVLYLNLGRTRYNETWELQKSLHSKVAGGDHQDIVLLTEHEHVYTLGKSGNLNHLLSDPFELQEIGVEYFETDRGGDITYHGPGQIVVYPILNLENFKQDIHHYLRQLEEVIIRTLSGYGITGVRSEGETGVWVDGEKIAAIGIKVNRWVTMHGFAFNVNTDLSYFERIIPCGIFHKGVTSLANVLKKEMSLSDVTSSLMKDFANVFSVELLAVETAALQYG